MIIPLPATQPAVVSGRALTEPGDRPSVDAGEAYRDVLARLGEPTVDLGPRKVLVYLWAVRQGRFVWLLGGPGGGTGGIEPWTAVHLFLVAFDARGQVLQAGTTELDGNETISAQVRGWLAAQDLAARVESARIDPNLGERSVLVVYRPSDAPCPALTFDARVFKPSIAVDGRVVGDLAAGEFTTVEVDAGPHAVTIDPYPDYRVPGAEPGSFGEDVRRRRLPVVVDVRAERGRPVYLESHLCTGLGRIEAHARIEDEPVAQARLRALSPAW